MYVARLELPLLPPPLPCRDALPTMLGPQHYMLGLSWGAGGCRALYGVPCVGLALTVHSGTTAPPPLFCLPRLGADCLGRKMRKERKSFFKCQVIYSCSEHKMPFCYR